MRAGNVIGGGDWAEDRIVPDAMRSLSLGEAIPVRNPRDQTLATVIPVVVKEIVADHVTLITQTKHKIFESIMGVGLTLCQIINKM